MDKGTGIEPVPMVRLRQFDELAKSSEEHESYQRIKRGSRRRRPITVTAPVTLRRQGYDNGLEEVDKEKIKKIVTIDSYLPFWPRAAALRESARRCTVRETPP